MIGGGQVRVDESNRRCAGVCAGHTELEGESLLRGVGVSRTGADCDTHYKNRVIML